MSEPTVQLVNRAVDEKPLDFLGMIAGISTDREEKGDLAKRALSCIRMGHMSVVEHISCTWRLTDVSRAMTHQLVRHRLASYLQLSQRYTRVSENAADWLVIPDAIEENDDAMSIFERCTESINEAYHQLLALGIKPEDARSLLPNATNTTIYTTMNMREFAAFYRLRTDKHAQLEIRKVAQAMYDTLYEVGDEQWREMLELLVNSKEQYER